MSLRIAFLVQGEGRGHMTQALALRQILERRGHRVSRVVLSRTGRRPTPEFFLRKIHAPLATVESPEFVADRDDRAVRKLSTLTHNLAQAPRLVGSIRELDEILGEVQPDVVVNFFDLLGGLHNRLYRPDWPMVCVGHQYLFRHPDFGFPGGHRFDRWALKTYTKLTASGAARTLALSFYPLAPRENRGLQVVPPLLREELFDQPLGVRENHLLVYLLNAGYREEILAWHEDHPDVPIHCFMERPGEPEEETIDETLSFHRIDDEKFLRLMATSRGVATTAGFESVCEAMYLDKPAYMVPVEGHFEQYCNAYDACAAGAGIRGRGFDLSALLRYEEARTSSPEPYRAWVERAPDLIAPAIEEVALGEREAAVAVA